MQFFAIFLLSCVALYILLKIGLYLYRPFLLKKLIAETHKKYEKLLNIMERDITEAFDLYNKWKSDDKSTVPDSKEQRKERLNEAMEAKKHEQEMFDKHIRLRERYIGDIKKLGEVIFNFNRYLDVRLKQCRDAQLNTHLLISGNMTFDEWVAAGNESRIIKEECERRIDVMLNS